MISTSPLMQTFNLTLTSMIITFLIHSLILFVPSCHQVFILPLFSFFSLFLFYSYSEQVPVEESIVEQRIPNEVALHPKGMFDNLNLSLNSLSSEIFICPIEIVLPLSLDQRIVVFHLVSVCIYVG